MSSLLCTLMAPIAVLALGTGQQVDRPEAPVPTAIERALMERACSATETVSAESYAHQRCLEAKLLWLRTDFGRDLSRLSGADRRRIDAACSRLRASDQREAYLDCLGAQLTAVHNRQNRGKPAVPEDGTVAPVASPEPAAVPPTSPAPQESSSRAPTLVGAIIAGLLVASGVGFVALRSRRTTHPCRVCSVPVAGSDLCATCRHEAAEALRRAAVERAQNQKAQEEEERRQRECEDEEREKKLRDEEEARLREQELARQRQADEELQRQTAATATVVPTALSRAAVEESEVFDPYAVLGVPSEAGQADIHAAYQSAITKYDPDLVSYLGDEAQAHFRAKTQSIERAYQMLSEARS